MSGFLEPAEQHLRGIVAAAVDRYASPRATLAFGPDTSADLSAPEAIMAAVVEAEEGTLCRRQLAALAVRAHEGFRFVRAVIAARRLSRNALTGAP